MDAVDILLNDITETLPQSRAQLRRLKIRVATLTRGALIRNDALLARYRSDIAKGARKPNALAERILTLNSIRSHSGIATVTVITQPYPCPGSCIYCPTQKGTPKSYMSNEPAVMRALRNDYDPYRQVLTRLVALHETGHPTDKVELLVKGGTWSFYSQHYQRWFIERCFDAANDFRSTESNARDTNAITVALRARPGPPGCADRTPDTALPSTLEDTQRRNETSESRIIGITIETRPDYVTENEIRNLRLLGVTRVELGVQILNEAILDRIARGHGLSEVTKATRLLRETGFKIAYHLMPNLPGATPSIDLESTRMVFSEASFMPDTVKFYPCVVVEGTELYNWWRKGNYKPYNDETTAELLIQMKQITPPSVRIERIIRDIPSNTIKAGCRLTNLREELHKRMRQRNLRCRCIRCRQVREDISGNFQIRERRYQASGGTEIFLSFEEPETERLASLLRLRIPPATGSDLPHLLRNLSGRAFIRELHTYGQHVPLHERRLNALQHRGFGAELIRQAERIVREEFRLCYIAAIAGVGAREYYRQLGYELRDTYMVKSLSVI